MNPGQHILRFGVRAYQLVLSPAKTFLFGPAGQCRFTPSCSEYAMQAIARHGALAGSWQALKRLARCHPWGGCGHDPVPEPPRRGFRSARAVFRPRLPQLHQEALMTSGWDRLKHQCPERRPNVPAPQH